MSERRIVEEYDALALIFSTLASDIPLRGVWLSQRHHSSASSIYTLILSICLRVVMFTPDTVLMAAA